MSKKVTTQLNRLFEKLSAGRKLHIENAAKNGLNPARLSRMVYDLRQEGNVINSTIVRTKSGKNVAVYTML